MVLKAGGKADRSARAIPEILLGMNLYEKNNDALMTLQSFLANQAKFHKRHSPQINLCVAAHSPHSSPCDFVCKSTFALCAAWQPLLMAGRL